MYFGFSRRELNGVCVLAVVLLLLGGVPHIFPFRGDVTESDLSVKVAEIDSFLAAVSKRQPTRSKGYHAAGEPVVHASGATYFTFDPNGLPVVDWKRLGLSERQVRMIKNYEAKGGRFRKKEDLRKIYAINDADYERLEPYIEIERVESVKHAAASYADSGMTVASAIVTPPPQALHIDLNGADSLELQYLPGIGPVFASRIVRFRELLGGFHHVSQLMDVYGFDSVRFAALRAHVYADTTKVQKIALNTADYERFRDHPFINHKLANAIVQYRKQHGPYRSMSDLLRIAIMDEQIFLKIAPYLTLADD
ncbi:ComEA family DNA-binding protein [Parapedobacter sp. 2B3]|uniref:ComEA family DNA-binding protein n=1 Tax=Parapedobacter sp. 2B3 TaxID=3342381 RepID=UPI0035B59764